MPWMQTFLTGIENGRVRELYLRKIPELKTCNDWTKVEEIGRITYRSKYASYNGGIVRLGEKYFFLTNNRMHALSSYRNWKFPKELRVVPEEEWKKKVTEFHDKQKKRK